MKSLRSRVKRAGLALALVLPASFTLLPATALSAAQPVRLRLFVGSRCFREWATGSATVCCKWKDSVGNIKVQGDVPAEGGLWYSDCTEDFTGPLIEPEDKFVV